MSNDQDQKNVLGEKLEPCSMDPVTGWFRDGCCNTDNLDHGVHTVCARVTTKFLEWGIAFRSTYLCRGFFFFAVLFAVVVIKQLELIDPELNL